VNFQCLINSLRQLVTSVKKAASQVNVSVGENEGAIRQLADEALNQAEEITRTLDGRANDEIDSRGGK